jgi:hypothetical protein
MWVFNTYKVPYQTRNIYGLEAYFPDYLNAVYQEKVYHFIDTLTKRYMDNKNIVQVDLRGYGEWGEWHSGYMHQDIATHAEALRQVIDLWVRANHDRFPLILSGSYEWRRDIPLFLHAPKSYQEFLYLSAFDYALSKNIISFRRDGIGGALKNFDYELFQDYFYHHHHFPLTTEFFIGYNRQKEPIDGVRGYFAEDALEEALSMHPNYMMLMWDSVSFHQERQDLIQHGLKRMGYRLYPEIIEINEPIEQDYVLMKHTWRNDGVGRIYGKHFVYFKLIDEFGHSQTILDHAVQLHQVIENKPVIFHSILKLAGLQGKIKLYVGVTINDTNEEIKLPLDFDSSIGMYFLIDLERSVIS